MPDPCWLPMDPQARLELLHKLWAAVPTRAVGSQRVPKDFAAKALRSTEVVQRVLAGAHVHLAQVR
jgi:hypothetical protein